MTPTLWGWVADAVLILHAGFVLFVVGGMAAIVVGNIRGWALVNRYWFRWVHLLAILVVVLESWLGIVCPLTALENHARLATGGGGYSRSFIEHWVGAVLFFDLPSWVFVVAYTSFGLLVLLTWWKYPPQRRIAHE
jgi:Protein of Unknown function (DUF2784)